jgi:prepilin-type processing-associated H-X9-DG protein
MATPNLFELLEFQNKFAARRSSCMARRGFSLIALIVVIIVIGFLIALLLPATERARESARRAQCTNNLMQIGLACMVCESNTGHYPAGGWAPYWCGDPDRGEDVRQPGGPINFIPYVEENTLYNRQKGTTGEDRKRTAGEMLSTPLCTLICPSRRACQAFPQITGADTAGFPVFNTRYVSDGELKGLTQVARNDYAGNGYDQVTLFQVDALKDEISAALGASGGSGGTGTAGMDVIFNDETKRETLLTFMNDSVAGKAGIFYPTSIVTVKQIEDGTANTYLFGEKYVCPDDYYTGKEHGDCFDAYGGAGPDVLRYSCIAGVLKGIESPAYHDKKGLHPGPIWGSAHVGGFNMAFCDGSVHMISFGIDAKLNEQLSNRADGSKADLSALNP